MSSDIEKEKGITEMEMEILADGEWHGYAEFLRLGEYIMDERATRLYEGQIKKRKLKRTKKGLPPLPELSIPEQISRGKERAIYGALMDMRYEWGDSNGAASKRNFCRTILGNGGSTRIMFPNGQIPNGQIQKEIQI